MKIALATTLLLLGGLVAGCGSDDSTSDAAASSSSASPSPSESSSGASDDASADPSTAPSTDASGAPGGAVSAEAAPLCSILTSTTSISTGPEIAALAASLSSVPPIPELTADQAKGLDLYVGALEDVDPQASAEEVAAITDLGFSTAQESKVQDFFTWAGTACAPAGPAPSADPSTSPSTDGQ